MGEEEPKTQINSEIDPKELIVQDGEDIGRIDAVESDPEAKKNVVVRYDDIPDSNEPGGFKQVEIGSSWDKTETISGLPVIGAEEEERVRELPRDEQFQTVKPGFIAETWSDMSEAEKEPFFDKAGTDAMAVEVGRRAEAMVADASEDLRNQVREAAEAGFRAEIEAKSAEKQKIADDKARELLAKLQGGAPISEILPEPSQEDEVKPETAYNSTDSRNIGLSLGGEDSMPHSEDEDSGIPTPTQTPFDSTTGTEHPEGAFGQ